MRVVAGQYGGRKLNVPKGRDIRPTSDKVRGAMFNTLGGYLDFDGARVLDAFCGTGALGIEAMSRGAVHCVFVDRHRASLDLARENVDMLGVDGDSRFVLSDAKKVHIRGDDPFDLVFLDPPYADDVYAPCLAHFEGMGALSDGCICVLESHKGVQLSAPQGYEFLKDKLYGDTRVTYLRYKKSVV